MKDSQRQIALIICQRCSLFRRNGSPVQVGLLWPYIIRLGAENNGNIFPLPFYTLFQQAPRGTTQEEQEFRRIVCIFSKKVFFVF